MSVAIPEAGRFVDLFAGCGGLSLGLCLAGWQGRFAIERDSMAFSTFRHNFVDQRAPLRFAWPKWLEKRAWSVNELLSAHDRDIRNLAGHVELVAGGPPCQGFSFAGRRKKADPRNRLFKRYVRFVQLVGPDALLIENVPGMQVVHGANDRRGRHLPGPVPTSFYEKLVAALSDSGYTVLGRVLDASTFGVPQRRPRLVVIGLRKELAANLPDGIERAFKLVETHRLIQLRELQLGTTISASNAISDLEVSGRERRPCMDRESPSGFFETRYEGPTTRFQRLMNAGVPNSDMDSMRLVRHTEGVVARLTQILKLCRSGVRMNDADRKRFGLLKHRIFPMHARQPAPTVTTLPDDVLHYREPRILTVRESARLQSFPDWFEFRGKYTTGGDRRVKECPRYTQVGNAVPPLLARVLGKAISDLLGEARVARRGTTESSAQPRLAALLGN